MDRAGAGTKYKDIGDIKRGEQVERIDISGSWWKVKTSSGKIGWYANTSLFKKV